MDFTVDVDGQKMTFEMIVEQDTRDLSDALMDRLIAIRKELGMTQQDVADIIGLPRTNVSRMERKLYTPTLGLLMKYANSLGKTIQLDLVDRKTAEE